MYKTYLNSKNGSFLIRMLLTLAVAAMLIYIIMKIPFSTVFLDKTIKEELKKQDIDVSDYSKIIDSAKQKAEEIDEAYRKREKMLDEIGSQ